MPDDKISDYDVVFVESIIEEINEMMMEKYGDDDTVPLLGLVSKDRLPGDAAIWLHIFRTEDVKKKIDND